jgi:hypothetical protein
MRHRAQRSILARIHLPALGRRGLAVVAGLAVTAALTGVGVALQQDAAEPSASASPTASDIGAPDGSAAPVLTGSPSKAVSRGGDRHAMPESSTTGPPSPTAADPTSTSPLATSPTATLATGTDTPRIGSPTTTNAPTPTKSTTTAPSPSPEPPADSDAPQTTASTSAVDSDSWTVALGADEPASYECSLDGGAYRSCGATTTFSGLDHGPHSMAARATDSAGNTDPSPATLSTKVTGSG